MPHPQASHPAKDDKTQTKDWRGQHAKATKDESLDLKDCTQEQEAHGMKNSSDRADHVHGESTTHGYARARLYLQTVKGGAGATHDPETVGDGARATQNSETIADGAKATHISETVGDEKRAYQQCDDFESINWSWTSWKEYSAHLDTAEAEVKLIMSNMPTLERQSAWYTWMTQALKDCPEQAILYLYVAIKYPWLEISQQQQLVLLTDVVVHFLRSAKPPEALHVDAIHQLACSYMRMAALSERPIFLDQHTIYAIQEHCSPNRRRSFLRNLLRYKVPLSGDTLLHFTAKFVEGGEISLGFEVLRVALNTGIDTDSYAVQSSCVKLLRTVAASRTSSETPSSVRDQTLQLGIKPNQILWTCIILAAVEARHYDEAWKWYYTGKLEGLKPDIYTMTVLLKIAKQGFDQDALDKIIELATEEGILPYNLDLVFDILHAAYVVNLSRPLCDPDRSFELVLSYYSRYCTIEQLQEIGLPVDRSVDQDDQFLGASKPSSMIIGMMLMVYLRSHSTMSTILPLYHQYRDDVMSKHPVIAPLANTDHIGNAFIKAFGSQSESLQYCTLVLKDMLASTTFGSLLSTDFKSTKPQNEGKPTVQTWNILLYCYMKHGYRGAAEKVLGMMHSRKISPDSFTWNHLIAGYARQQDVKNVIYTSERMRATGNQPDQFTLKALRHLADKATYLRSLEETSQSDEPVLVP